MLFSKTSVFTDFKIVFFVSERQNRLEGAKKKNTDVKNTNVHVDTNGKCYQGYQLPPLVVKKSDGLFWMWRT